MYLGRNVNEYAKKSMEIITQAIADGKICCALCLKQMRRHSKYDRGIKETGEELTITVVWCRKCKKWHALLPDFLLPHKHYSGNEIESVIIDSAAGPLKNIDREASEPTVRRWIKQIGERIKQAISQLKLLFGKPGKAVSEIKVDPGDCHNELEQMLELAPEEIKCSGNKLGLANLWLGTNGIPAYI